MRTGPVPALVKRISLLKTYRRYGTVCQPSGTYNNSNVVTKRQMLEGNRSMTLKRNWLLAILSMLVAALVVVACQPAQTPGGQAPAPSAAGESATPQPPPTGEAEA